MAELFARRVSQMDMRFCQCHWRKAGLPAPFFAYDLSGFRIEFKKSSAKSSVKIIELIKSNGSLTVPEIARHLEISKRAVEKQIANLKAENRIRRVGSLRGGYWEVLEQ